MSRYTTEDREACALMGRMEWQYPELYDLAFHVPNETRTHISTAVKLKKMGVKAGVPDYFLAVPVGRYHGLWIELKAPDQGCLSKAQKHWMTKLVNQGYAATVAYGADDAIWVISEYLIDVEIKTFRTRRDAKAAAKL
jgi:hypothetical protein